MKTALVNVTGGRWRIYKEPVPEHFYVIGADSASGIPGRNGSAAHVMDVNEHEVVAVFDAVVTPDVLAAELRLMGWRYNMALVAPESMYHGVLVLYLLVSNPGTIYPNVFKHEGSYTSDNLKIASDYGWKQGEENRNVCLSMLQSDVGIMGLPADKRMGRELKVIDGPTLDSMDHMIRNAKGKVEAGFGYCDDLVMSLAITNAVAHQVERTIPKKPSKPTTKTLWDQWRTPSQSNDTVKAFFDEPVFQKLEGFDGFS
jgi:hypothetical protein